ncbi:LemA family protein [Pelagicoccus mobilis]|uniref:LemA family protein n=1 Tax=Pelagicoccus mobilis TaxID=415221 RepID=A0A934S1E5_9BACT|nr:LemA family protein [Pelagicoccus mobilis]MBK1878821.1 LemA family protein [Pelagicoccus mobilis]
MSIAFIVIVVLILLVLVVMYNGLVGKKNQVENAFAGMDTMLKKRYDLIPNLVATVKQYASHEEGTLTKVTELRAKAIGGGLSADERIDLDNQISKAMGGIMVAVENYPELKANENFLQLQRSLNEVEEQISASRRAYNASVTSYNNAIEMFPSNMMANAMNYKRKAVFEIPEVERANVDVGKLFGS